jgi:hypothetical protein
MSTANYDTYEALRQAEDVEDIIYNVSPIDNPVASMSRTTRATGKLHEWTEDELGAAAANALVEGADAGADTSQPVTEKDNYCQIMGKVARISGTLEEVDKYGRDSEMAYQLELRYGELANDEELAIIGAPGGTRQSAAAATQSTARTMACFQIQMLAGRNAASNVVSSTAVDLGDLEEELLTAHEGCYEFGGNPRHLIVPPKGGRYVAGFAASSGRTRDFGGSKQIINVIDLYSSPYGELEVVLDRHCERVGQGGSAENIMAGIDFQYLATPVLRATRDWPLAKTGDSENRQILRESTLAVLNTDAHFLLQSISDDLIYALSS